MQRVPGNQLSEPFKLVRDARPRRAASGRPAGRLADYNNRPILIRDPGSGAYEPALGYERGRLRVDWLFSYQPNPGTVLFAGYGSTLTEAGSLGLRGLRRASDGFFVKFSYLFRL